MTNVTGLFLDGKFSFLPKKSALNPFDGPAPGALTINPVDQIQCRKHRQDFAEDQARRLVVRSKPNSDAAILDLNEVLRARIVYNAPLVHSEFEPIAAAAIIGRVSNLFHPDPGRDKDRSAHTAQQPSYGHQRPTLRSHQSTHARC